MKTARAHYRIRGGRLLAGVIAVLTLTLFTLVVRLKTVFVGEMVPHQTVLMVLINLTLLLVLTSYAVVHRATLLWRRARDGVMGTRLQSRIITMFCVIAILPTLVVALFSVLFFNAGIKSWFDTKVTASLENSASIATAYIAEHKDAIRNDAIAMAQWLEPKLPLLTFADGRLEQELSLKIGEYDLSEAIVLDKAHVLARTGLSFSLAFERLPESVIGRADSGRVVIFGDARDKIQALIKLSHLPELYLMVVRVVDPQVLSHMQAALETVNEYHQLQSELTMLQQQFFAVFVLVALLVLMTSLWAGMLLAVRLVEPLRALMEATEQVRAGDYTIKVPEGRKDDEIGNLGRTFNRMTGQLETGRRDLMEANRLIDERRRFTEAVLSGVSAGIIALDRAQHITLHNRKAAELLSVSTTMVLQPITAILPDILPLMEAVKLRPERIAQGDLLITLQDQRRTLHVQVTAERLEQDIEGFIVTFDDITALVSAQRSAAWADVARRIAHEIKNPLTPITLSTDRLRKKFAPTEEAEREAFDRYLDTIARHTRDIGRMVEEFVGYARLPTAVFAEENLTMLLRKVVFSEQTAHADIRYTLDLPEKSVPLLCDEGQLGQALLNLLKNAAEAMEQSAEKEIRISLQPEAARITVTIEDTGSGFPPDKIAQLTEPYVTTRAKGTGLGLAIVKRTVEEHKGTLTLANQESGGARVTIVFEA